MEQLGVAPRSFNWKGLEWFNCGIANVGTHDAEIGVLTVFGVRKVRAPEIHVGLNFLVFRPIVTQYGDLEGGASRVWGRCTCIFRYRRSTAGVPLLIVAVLVAAFGVMRARG